MKRLKATLLALAAVIAANAETVTINMADYGVKPGRNVNSAPLIEKALTSIKKKYQADTITITFLPGRYDFHEKGASTRSLFISNHDQNNPKKIGVNIDGWSNLTIDFSGADFMFHGRMLPIVVTSGSNVALRNLHIDFPTPHISQIEVIANSETEGITFRTAPWVNGRINSKSAFEARGEGWTLSPRSGIAFDKVTRHLVYRTSDLYAPLDSVVATGRKDTFRAPRWRDARLTPGTIVALRGWGRPTPGIFLAESNNTTLDNIKVHYAEGMGLLAQLCDTITMRDFGVCLRGDNDPRYFTTQADATHFSGCRGLITSVGGLYEGMMDDAINVHGTYLKITGIKDRNTVVGRYMHEQSYGFKWGEPGDSLSLLLSRSMDTLPYTPRIVSITPLNAPTAHGAKEFEIKLSLPLPDNVKAGGDYGLENLSWCPEVYFADNVIRNNRARGSLFSTPRRTIVERNLFDHTSGTAILLCGDCMGWFETGACHDVTIRQNRFVNALTNMFQFTEAVISIYPEIHDLASQQTYFHSGIVIDGNIFQTFDAPILYAKSVDGLTFSHNTVIPTHDFKPFHPNTFTFRLLRTRNVNIDSNNFNSISPSVNIE